MTKPTHQLVAEATCGDYTARCAVTFHDEPELDDMQRLLDATLQVFKVMSSECPPEQIKLTAGCYNPADWDDPDG